MCIVVTDPSGSNHYLIVITTSCAYWRFRSDYFCKNFEIPCRQIARRAYIIHNNGDQPHTSDNLVIYIQISIEMVLMQLIYFRSTGLPDLALQKSNGNWRADDIHFSRMRVKIGGKEKTLICVNDA